MEPIRLKIKDFYSIAKGEIDFTKFLSSLILGEYEDNVLKSNGCGKSSVQEAIAWVLFNETRQSKVDDIIRWTANEAVVEFEFGFDGKIYKVVRRRSRVSKEVAVSLFIKEADKWINDSSSTTTETNKKICELLNIDATIFLNSVYFRQHDISLFANSSPSDRKEIIKSIMKLGKWDEYQKQAKNELKTTKDELGHQLRIVNENNNLDILKTNNERLFVETNNTLEKLVIQQKNVQEKLALLKATKKENDVITLSQSLETITVKVNVLKADGKKLQNRQMEIEEQLKIKTNKRAEHIKTITVIEKEINRIMAALKRFESENCAYQELEADILAKKIERGRISSDLDTLNNTSSMLGVGQCQFCLTEITEESLPHIHNDRAKKEKQLKNDLNTITNALDVITTEYNTRSFNKRSLDNLVLDKEKNSSKLFNENMQKSVLDDAIRLLENENNTIITSIRAIIDQIKSHKIEALAIEQKIEEQKNNDIDHKIKQTENNSNLIAQQINSGNMQLGSLLKEKEIIEQKIIILDKTTKTLIKLNKNKTSYEQLVRFFGKDGIQAIFIESIVDELEKYANETLSYICNEPSVIKLKTQKRTNEGWQETLEIDVIINGNSQTFESLSGGEKFRISLALRIGLSEVLVKRAGGEIKLLLLDEIDTPLDAFGLSQLMAETITGLEKRFKILMISHNNSMRDRFINVINVVKTSNGSFLTQN
jgi:DNA repair exonuclease SbcCD ATPase subunit